MQNGKKLNAFRSRGALGVLALVLVGIMAFASYRTSYPVTPETELETESSTDASVTQASATGSSVSKAQETSGEKEENLNLADANTGVADTKGKGEGEESDAKEKKDKEKTQEADQVLSGEVISPTVKFSEDASLSWPTAGTVLMDYSMDGTVYFQTLNEYKYNPALIIASEAGNPVVASAKGIVESIDIDEETGTTITTNIGDDYELIYGQLKEVAVTKGDVVEQGQLLGYISEPTKYYCEEGSNLYFAMKKDGQIVDPCQYLDP